jgi:hypothetical protein
MFVQCTFAYVCSSLKSLAALGGSGSSIALQAEYVAQGVVPPGRLVIAYASLVGIYVTASADGGSTWPVTYTLATAPSYTLSSAMLALNDNGAIAVVWLTTGSVNEIMAWTTTLSDLFGTPSFNYLIAASGSGNFTTYYPRLSPGPGGTFMLAYQTYLILTVVGENITYFDGSQWTQIGDAAASRGSANPFIGSNGIGFNGRDAWLSGYTLPTGVFATRAELALGFEISDLTFND